MLEIGQTTVMKMIVTIASLSSDGPRNLLVLLWAKGKCAKAWEPPGLRDGSLLDPHGL